MHLVSALIYLAVRDEIQNLFTNPPRLALAKPYYVNYACIGFTLRKFIFQKKITFSMYEGKNATKKEAF